MQSFTSHTFKMFVIAGLIISAAIFNQKLIAGTMMPGVAPCVQEKPVQEENVFVGTWKVAMGERAGEKVADERRGTEIEFTDKQIMIPVPGGR